MPFPVRMPYKIVSASSRQVRKISYRPRRNVLGIFARANAFCAFRVLRLRSIVRAVGPPYRAAKGVERQKGANVEFNMTLPRTTRGGRHMALRCFGLCDMIPFCHWEQDAPATFREFNSRTMVGGAPSERDLRLPARQIFQNSRRALKALSHRSPMASPGVGLRCLDCTLKACFTSPESARSRIADPKGLLACS